ncbi:MAG: XdhC family protein [Longimicrobiales bacterium]|nr:XdhC family protein [Longimicrobiales bacterium]
MTAAELSGGVGVVPCAGRSRRMGRSKALLDADGEPFLARAVAALREGGCERVLVVVSDASGPEARLARRCGARVLSNSEPGPGPISSLRVALRALAGEGAGVEDVVFLPVDHPDVRPATVAALLAAPAGPAVVVPRWEGRRGHPVLFRPPVFAELLDPALEGGARTVVRRDPARVLEVEVTDAGVCRDVDTPEAYRARFGRDPGADSDRASDAEPEPGGPTADLAPVLGATRAAEVVAEQVAVRASVAVVTLLAERPRRRVTVREPGGAVRRMGTVGTGALDADIDALADRGLAGGGGDGGRAPDGVCTVAGETVFLEIHRPEPELVIVGAGHIARPLATLGDLLGFRVTVADDRPDFASRERFPAAARVLRVDFSDPFRDIPLGPQSHLVLVTRGHRYDYECLRRVLLSATPPGYLGMIGSRRRVRATFQALAAEGVPRERLASVRAPVGLDVGAETPAEIAVAVAAEILLERRGGTGAPLHRVERVLERLVRDPPADEDRRARSVEDPA